MMTKDEERTVFEAAAHEWDTTDPKRPMPRQAFIDWHLRMARDMAKRQETRNG